MIDAGIFDGDFVVVRQQSTAANGDIVVAMLGRRGDRQALLPRGRTGSGLQPENSTMEPIYARDVTILGKVVALFRRSRELGCRPSSPVVGGP